MSLLGGLEEVVEFFFRRALSLSKSAIRASALSNCSCNWATTASSRLQPGQCSLCVPMPQQHKDDFGNHLHQFAIFVTAYDVLPIKKRDNTLNSRFDGHGKHSKK